VAGLIALWRDRTPAARFVLAWVLLAPLLGALTVDPPHATRTIALLPALQVVAARGALLLLDLAGRRRGLAATLFGVALAASAAHATWAHFTAPARTPPHVWRPHAARTIETARTLARERGASHVHFLDADPTDVTWVDWLHLTDVPTEALAARPRTRAAPGPRCTARRGARPPWGAT
jgi:hypothetical protein